jgi:hypothetical protein
MSATIDDAVSDDYLAQYNFSLAVAAIQKIDSFALLQVLNYNGMKASIAGEFLSLEDWGSQIALYSAANTGVLHTPYLAIKSLVPLNIEIIEELVYINGLGLVGDLFENLPGYGAAFTISDTELTSPSAITDKASSLA